MSDPSGPGDRGRPAGERVPGEAAGRERPTTVHPGWGTAPPLAAAPSHLSRASTVQVLGIFSIVTLPLCGVGLVLAVITLAMARAVRRELAEAGGRGPGGREVRVGVVCALVSVGLGGLFLVGWILVLALAVGSAS